VSVDRRCQAIAKRQHGVLTRTQLLEEGLTAQAITTRLATGYLEVLHPRVYGVRGTPDSWAKRVTAAFLWGGPGAVMSHRTAAALYELDGTDRSVLEITLPGGRTRKGIVCHRFPSGPKPRTRQLDTVKVTWLDRTLLDLCAVVRPPRAGLALDDALRKRMTTLERLWAELDATGGLGRKGSAVFRQLLGLRDDRDGSMESRLETATKRLLATPPLPVVTPQFRIFDGKSYVARLDFAYPHALLGVEAHSFRWHADLERWKRDQARDNKLKLLGWAVLHYTWDEVHFDRDRVINEIRRMLARATTGFPI
jgi:hypothetical protein